MNEDGVLTEYLHTPFGSCYCVVPEILNKRYPFSYPGPPMVMLLPFLSSISVPNTARFCLKMLILNFILPFLKPVGEISRRLAPGRLTLPTVL